MEIENWKLKITNTKRRRIAVGVFATLLIVGGLAYYKIAYGVTRTWDGGGTDGTCGGAGTANNWSCAANWSGDTTPTASDIATFDGTSTKNATINANISVAGIDINTGYTGTITQSGSYTVTVGSSHYDQAAGTFTGGSGTIDINGTYTLSGGTFTSTSGILEIGYYPMSNGTVTFNHSGGTFNHNNGAVTFGSSNSSPSGAFTVSTSTTLTFYNLAYNPSNTGTLTASGTIVVANDFTQTNGLIGGSWQVQGNVVIGSSADGGGGTLTMTGTGARNYTYSAGGIGPRISIDNASISVAANGGTTDLNIRSFSILSGTFTAPTGMMTIGLYPESNPLTVFNHSGGTFNHNNGAVTFGSSNSSPSNIFTVSTSTTLTFYNLAYNPSNTGTLTASGTIVVANDFTQTRARIAGSWQVQGNVVIGSSADGGTGTLAFTGGNAQTYTDNGGNEPDGDITVNKSAGTLTLASSADWNATNQDLTITSGTLAQSTYDITTTNFTVNGGTFTGGSGTVTTAGPMLVSSGTFTGGNGNIDVNNTFTLSGGTFTSTSGTLEIGRTINDNETILTISGGTFNHNNGTVAFRFTIGVGDSFRTYTVDVPSSLTLYDLIVDVHQNVFNDLAYVTTAAGDSVIALNNFTHSDGILLGTWETQGNVIIGSTADGGSGTLTMTGTGAKTYAYSAGGTGSHLRINNASVSVSAAGGTTDLKIGAFSLLSGAFNAPGGTFEIGRNGSGDETILAVSSGTFNHNNGTVALRLTMGVGNGFRIYTVDVPSSLTLYDLVVDVHQNIYNDLAYVTTAAGDSVIALNNFTHSDGILQGAWQVQGNTTVATTADGGTATLSFTGGNDQTYTDQGGNEPNGDITVNKSAGTLTLASNADWNASNQDLTITQGTLRVAGTAALSTTALTVGSAGVLKMIGTGDLTLAGNVSNSGAIVIESNQACGGADDIQILSSSAGVQRTWSGSGSHTIYDATVKDQGGSAAITAYSSTSVSGNGGNWTFSGAACPGIPPAATLGTGLFRLGTGVVNLR